MITEILKPSISAYKKAAALIHNDEVVAFPTETVYGLGASALSDEAVQKIFDAKGRPSNNPLIVHLHSPSEIKKYVKEITPIHNKLINTFMPGPISIIFEKNDKISSKVCAGGSTVAIRIPENKVAQDFLRFVNLPICAPSANTSTRPSPTTAYHVFEDMNTKIPLIIDGGTASIGIESTVVKVVNNQVYILRPGKITKQDIEQLCNVQVIDNTQKIELPKTSPYQQKPTVYASSINNSQQPNQLQTTQPKPQVKIVYCENCGTQINSNEKFCLECGALQERYVSVAKTQKPITQSPNSLTTIYPANKTIQQPTPTKPLYEQQKPITKPTVSKPAPKQKKAKEENYLKEIIVRKPIELKSNAKAIQSPGTRYPHYKPKCEMIIVKSDVKRNINKLYKNAINEGKKPVIFCKKESLFEFAGKQAISLGADSNEASANYFSYLRQYENHDIIICEYINNGTMVEALFNRMIKSASGKII